MLELYSHQPRHPNSLELSVSLQAHSRIDEKASPLRDDLARASDGLAYVIQHFFANRMPHASQGANLYDVQYNWKASQKGSVPNVIRRGTKGSQGRKAPQRIKFLNLSSGRTLQGPTSALLKTHFINTSFANVLKNSQPGPYIILKPRLSNQILFFDYEDSFGNKLASEPIRFESYAVSPVATTGWPSVPYVQVPSGLDALIDRLVSRFATVSPGHDDPEVLPIFVDLDKASGNIPFDLVAERLPPIASRWTQIEIVRLARKTWQRRAPFSLPLRVGANSPALADALATMRARDWYSGNIAVQQFGLQISASRPIAQTLHPPQDLVLCGTADLQDMFGTLNRMDLEDRPRVIIAVGDPILSPVSFPDGVSVLLVSSKSGPAGLADFVKEFLYGIIHDGSLPAALKAATLRAGEQLAATPRLISDPHAIRDLRFKDALVAVLDEALNLHNSPSVDMRTTDWRGTKYVPKTLRRVAEKSESMSMINKVLSLNANFSRESLGLIPIAEARKTLDRAHIVNEIVTTELAQAAREASTRRTFTSLQQRRADITLLRDEPNYSYSLFVRPGEKLQAGANFWLRMQIGRRSPASIVIGENPPIDPLLPNTDPKDGHYLHAALFAQDFTSRSQQMCRVFLPRFGSSEAVFFAISAPTSHGFARFRIGIYYDLPGETEFSDEPSHYRNHLLQMFLLEATVGEASIPLSEQETGLGVRLEFSRTSRFANLDQLSERRLSIAINDDPKGSHRLLMKGGTNRQDVLWSETAGDEALRKMRTILEEVTWDTTKAGPRFPEDLVQKPEAEFDKSIERLARAGGTLYHSLWTQAREDFQDVLRNLQDDSEKVIQITRLATNFLFPWASLYDFDRPSTKTDPSPITVCKGFTRPGFSCRQCLDNCLFPDKSQTYCVYGFWGMRHKLEQLLHTPFQGEDAIVQIKRAAQNAVHISVGVTGQIVDQFVPTLKSTLGKDSVYDLHSLEEMMKLLWSQTDRPAILLVLGHYEKPADNEPRITFAGDGWFEPGDITKEVIKLRKWKDSNPVVVLAACESAAANLESITSFLAAFADARAAAVIGTETTVFEGLACRFAKEISVALMEEPDPESDSKKKSLGLAVLEFRRRLLLDFNPLGLVFTPYGDADLHRA